MKIVKKLLHFEGLYPFCPFFSCKRSVYICNVLFLSARPECRDVSRHSQIFIFFVPPKKRGHIPRDYIPFAHFFVNVLFTYAMYFFFLHGQNAGTYPDTLEYSFFFVPPKKNESRKRRPPETPIPLRMPVMAKWAKLASLRQTPIFYAMPFILIVRQSRPTSHSRNGAAWKQMQTITYKDMLGNLSSFS